jgi:para-nitrobenzyl esterase
MVFAVTPELQHDPRAGERKLYSRVPFIQRGTF